MANGRHMLTVDSGFRQLAFVVGNVVLLGCGGSTSPSEPPTVVTPPAQSAPRASEQPFHCYAAEANGENVAGCEPTLDQCKASLAESTRQGAKVVEACYGVAQAYCLQFNNGMQVVWTCRKTEADCATATAWVNTVFPSQMTSACAKHATHPGAP